MNARSDDLILIGASHRTASVDLRGRLTTAVGRAEAWLAHEGGAAGVGEMFVLATCHRVEVLVLAANAGKAQQSIVEALFGGADIDSSALYIRRGPDAVEHLARVACGLDSLIVGEAEVSGQVRRALHAGRAAGSIGPALARVIADALRAAGQARSVTRIGAGTISAAGAAVSVLEQAWGSLERHSVLVIGAGDAARQALHRLRRRGAGRLIVASRSTHHAREAAERYGAQAIALDDVAREMSRVDGVIAAARATRLLIDPDMCPAGATSDPLQIIDLSMPRVVHPSVGDLPGVLLYTVDDLGDVVRESLRRRAREVPDAERILADEAARTYERFIARRDGRVAVA